jgi:L-2,4-diaminobutyrate decarboxylase
VEAPVVLHGEHAHYSVTRAVAQLGLGTRRAITIPSRDLKMDVAALERRLEELARDRVQVMAVVATAGSTATGTFDDLDAIGRVCETRGVWLHVDGAHGASALLSGEHRSRLRGIERASSVAWDPHKMMLLPLSAGLLLVRDERHLDAAFAQQAPYLFHGEEGARIADQGVRSFMCSRRGDALKVWVALQRHGADGIGVLYDHLCGLTSALHDAIARRSDFESMHVPESNILCFRWIGSRPRDGSSLDELNRELRERYNRSGRGWITSTLLEGRRVLRVTMMNPRTREEHVTRLLDGLAQEAQTLP